MCAHSVDVLRAGVAVVAGAATVARVVFFAAMFFAWVARAFSSASTCFWDRGRLALCSLHCVSYSPLVRMSPDWGEVWHDFLRKQGYGNAEKVTRDEAEQPLPGWYHYDGHFGRYQ
eukprot:SAG31_NODE_478_length_15144_cov_15.165769_15_plen_116_part_00